MRSKSALILGTLLILSTNPIHAAERCESVFDTTKRQETTTVLGPTNQSKTGLLYENYSVHKVETKDGIALSVLELVDASGRPISKGEPVLLVHGFSANVNSWFQIANELRGLGYRVFVANYRGHGQGDARSLPADGRLKDNDPRLTFDDAAAYDIEALVNFTYRRSGGKRVTYVAHSQGGMLMHVALSGLTRNIDGSYVGSLAKAERLANKLFAFIPIGSPVDVANNQGRIADAITSLTTIMGVNLDKTSDRQWRRINPAYDLHVTMMSRAKYELGLKTGMYKMGMNLENMSPAEYQKLSDYAGSDVPKPYLRSVTSFKERGGYVSPGGRVDYRAATIEGKGIAKVRTVAISGDLDGLAPLEGQIEMTRTRGIEHHIVKETGHLDLTIGEKAPEVVGLIDQIIRP